jgi:cytochrome c5
MADHAEMTKTTPTEFLSATLGGLLAPGIAIALIVGLVVSIQSRQVDSDAAAANQEAVLERIKPIGSVVVAEAGGTKAERNGEQVYNEVCAACHGSGALGAPKYQDKGAWAKRIAQGWDTLLKNAIGGVRSMPPRGGSPGLSDKEVAAAVAYMANASGGKFTAP